MSDVGYSGVANFANTTLGNSLNATAGNFQQVRGVGADGVAVSPNYVRDALRILSALGTNAHVYLPGATQTSYGPELVTNGDFSSASGWTVGAGITVSGGVANISAGAGYIEQGIPTVAGVTYTVTAIATGNATYCGAWASSGQSTALSGSPGGRAAGVVTFTFTAGGATSYIGFTATGGGALTLDSVSTRVVTTSSAVISGLTAGNYLLSDGSSGYSQVDGLQGLCLDAMGAVGAELVTNGSFATDTNWTKGGGFTITGGSLVGTAVANFVGCTQTITLVAGGRYFIEYDLVVTSGSLRAYFSGGSNALGVEYTTSGHKSEYVVAVTGNTTLVLSSQAIGFTGTVDNISVREVTGIHATSTARPTLRRGLTNLLTYSNDATNAIWAVSGTATKPSASTINIPTVSDWVYQQITTVSGAAMTLGVVLSGTGTVKIGTNSGGLTTTSITLTSTPTLYVHNLTVGAVTTYCIAAFHDTGNTATSVTFGGAGLFSGTLTASQIISEGSIPLTTTAAASNPSAGRYSSQFAGAQSLLIGNLGITNAATIVIAGVLNSLASIQVMFGEAANGVQIYVPPNGTIVFDKNGSGGLVTSGLAQIVAGTPFVITARLLGGTAVIRKNGVQIATASSALVFAATTGARIGTAFDGVSFQCTGSLGMVIPLPVALTDAECLTVERLVASNFPNAPVF